MLAMTHATNQALLAQQFKDLHHRPGQMLVLPNVWDVIGALMLLRLGYPAVATASAAVAWSRGYDDGEQIPFSELLQLLHAITKRCPLPLSVDFENGFAGSDAEIRDHVLQLLECGVVGINFEDTDARSGSLTPLARQSDKIRLIRETAKEAGIPLFINARTDVAFHGALFANQEAKMAETIARGLAFKAAGADGFYPIALRDEMDIQTVIEQVPLPLNVLTLAGIPDLKRLQQMGVARLSLGPSWHKYAMQAQMQLALKLQQLDGLEDIAGNTLSSDFVREMLQQPTAPE